MSGCQVVGKTLNRVKVCSFFTHFSRHKLTFTLQNETLVRVACLCSPPPYNCFSPSPFHSCAWLLPSWPGSGYTQWETNTVHNLILDIERSGRNPRSCFCAVKVHSALPCLGSMLDGLTAFWNWWTVSLP